MSTRIVLVDDHKIVRDGLRALLEGEDGVEVVAEAEDGRQAVELIRRTRPDVAIMDVGLPELNGIDATRQIIETSPGIKVIALSIHSDTQFVSGMFSAGASAYLFKNSAFEELALAISEVMADQIYMSPRVAGVVVDDYLQHLSGVKSPATGALSDREREVLQLLVEGKDTGQVAFQLNVSPKTVATHRQHIMDKLDIHNLPDLTKYALREGLTFLEG